VAQRNDIAQKTLSWLEERTGLASWLRREILDKRAPRHRRAADFFGCFGGLSLVFIFVQVLSGIALLAFYVPHPGQAYESIVHLMTEVPLGWLLRRVHCAGAGFLVVMVLIHTLRVFYRQAYKSPRELHWVSGVALFTLVLAMNFTGYLLPWSELSYWATTIALSALESLPLVGNALASALRGGAAINAVTLGRFYLFHVAVIPITLAVLLAAHFTMIRKTGISRPL
jgi:ubiquinol-cytochrome c reductase cytochrome b subunit